MNRLTQKIKRWWWSRHAVLIPRDRANFEIFCTQVLTTFGLEDSKKNHEQMAVITFRLDFKFHKIVPKFYFDTIHRTMVNEMIYEWTQQVKKEDEAKKKVDEVKLSLLSQSGPQPEPRVTQEDEVTSSN